LPLGLKIFKAGIVSIKIDKTENLDKKVTVFIFDKLTGISYEISKKPFEISLEPGEYLNRFSVTFKKAKGKGKDKDVDENRQKSDSDSLIAAGDFLVYMNNTKAELQISKPVDAEIDTINLYNYLGQLVKTWSTNINESVTYLPINVSAGAYIVQVNTKTEKIIKKIVIR
jgi:hypothetical protein